MSDLIHVIAFLTVAPGQKDKAQEGLAALVAKVQEHEPDTLQYQYYWDEKNYEFVFIEKYKSMDAVAHHKAQTYFNEMKAQAEAQGLLAKPIDARVIVPTGGFTR